MHKFEVLGSKFLFDENTNSLHEVDQLVWDIMQAPSWDEADVKAHLAGRYAWPDVEEALTELRQLVAAGQIMNEPTPAPQLPQPSDEPQVKALCLHLAHDCNLRCVYCFAGTGPFGGRRELMPLAVGKAALDMLMRTSGTRRHLEVDFFGGEPLLNFPVVKELVRYGRALEAGKDKEFRFTLTTNGTLLTPEVQEWLNQEQIAAVLSLDGRQAVNDYARPLLVVKAATIGSCRLCRSLQLRANMIITTCAAPTRATTSILQPMPAIWWSWVLGIFHWSL